MKIKSLFVMAMASMTFGISQANDFHIVLESEFLEGTSTISGYEDAVILNSVDMEFMSNYVSGPAADKSVQADLSYCGVETEFMISKNVDISTPHFIEQILFGRAPESYTITMLNTGADREPLKVMRLQLSYPLIASYKSSASSGEGRPVENIGLVYQSIRGQVFEYDETGRRVGKREFNLDCAPG